MNKIKLQKITPELAKKNSKKIINLIDQLNNESTHHITSLKLYIYFIDELENKNQPMFFIRDSTYNIVGIVKLIFERKILHNFMRVAHIEDFVIGEKYRGFGYGKLTIEEIKKYCFDMNCYKIILNCNDDAKKFYEKCGFQNNNHEMSCYFYK